MRRLLLLLFLSVPLSAQYARMEFQLQNAQGQAISGATIVVSVQSACGAPVTGPATLYPSANGGTPVTQPLHTNGKGQASAYAAPGCYTTTYASPSTGTLSYPDQIVGGNGPQGPQGVEGPPGGVANISNQGAGIIPLGTSATAIQAQSHMDDGVTTANRITSTVDMQAPSIIPATSPAADVRAYGAVIDGTTDMTTPLVNSIAAQCANASTVSCKVLLNCGQIGCYMANGSAISATPGHTLTLTVQGRLFTGSTLVLPDNSTLLGDSGGTPGAFQNTGPVATVGLKAQYRGTLGTDVAGLTTGTIVTGTGSLTVANPTHHVIGETVQIFGAGAAGALYTGTVSNVAGSVLTVSPNASTSVTNGDVTVVSTFTPAFTTGTISNVQIGTAITIAEIMTCPASASRTATTSDRNTIYTATGACTVPDGETPNIRIPTGAIITVTGCSDSAFNVTAVPVQDKDYVVGSVTTRTTGSGTATATGCSVVGFYDDSYETVRITGVSGSNLTATFAHNHDSTAPWGMVGVTHATATNQHHDITNIAITAGAGLAYWGNNISGVNFRNDAFSATAFITSGAVEMAEVWWGQIENSTFLTSPNQQCRANCTQPSYPWGLRCTQLPSTVSFNGIGCSLMTMKNTSVLGGVKVDTNGDTKTNCCGAPPFFDNVTFEQVMNANLTWDNRNLPAITHATFKDSWQQDNFSGVIPPWVEYTDLKMVNGPETYIEFGRTWDVTGYPGTLVNKYFTGRYKSEEMYQEDLGGLGYGPIGTLCDGTSCDTELRGIGYSNGPSLIPHATRTVTAAASVTCGANCSVTTGITAPDQSTGAIQLSDTASLGNFSTVGTVNTATAVGDVFIYGAWVRSTNSGLLSSSQGVNIPLRLFSSGVDTLMDVPAKYGMELKNDDWHPQIVMTQVTKADAALHNVNFWLLSAQTVGNGNQFYGWFWMYIPASEGYRLSELQQWRRYLLHGYVPPSATAGTLYSNAAVPINVGPLTAATLNATAARKGTFICTGAGTITITNANYIATSDVVITMNTAGGTITTPPAMKTVTANTGFTVLCGATDTSIYNYAILN